MKGLMVTLLILSCTGMVWAQQEYNNGFRPTGGASDGSALGGSSNRDRGKPPVVPIVSGDRSAGARNPAVENNTRSQGNARARNAFGISNPSSNPSSSSNEPISSSGSGTSGLLDPNRPVRESFPRESFPTASGATNPSGSLRNSEADKKVIYLGLPTTALQDLQTNGVVVAPVKNAFVDRITISDRNVPKAGPTRTIQPTLRGDSLVFRFTRDDLEHIHDGSLDFEVPASVKGKYRTATIEYPPVLDRVAQSTTNSRTTNSRSVTENRTNVPPRNDSRFRSDDSRWRLAGGTVQREPIQTTSPWQRDNQSTAVDRQRLEYENWQREKETQDKIELAARNQQLQDQLQRLRYEQQQALQRTRQQQPQPQQQPYRPDPRYADRSFDTGLQQPVIRPVVPPSNNDSMVYTMLQGQMQQMQTRIAQLDNQNHVLSNEVRAVKADRDDLLRGRFAPYNNDYRNSLADSRNPGVGVNDQRFETKPELSGRPLMSTGDVGGRNRDDSQSGIDPLIRDVTDANRKQNSWNLLMFLMLLCSVGLNLYLWAISRGFYLRYQELADELRETFTVTA